jgi:hypothetical protein
VPELRARALCGASIEAAFIAHAMDRITNARSLSRDIGVSYAAAHAAVERLVGRGLLLQHRMACGRNSWILTFTSTRRRDGSNQALITSRQKG